MNFSHIDRAFLNRPKIFNGVMPSYYNNYVQQNNFQNIPFQQQFSQPQMTNMTQQQFQQTPLQGTGNFGLNNTFGGANPMQQQQQQGIPSQLTYAKRQSEISANPKASEKQLQVPFSQMNINLGNEGDDTPQQYMRNVEQMQQQVENQIDKVTMEKNRNRNLKNIKNQQQFQKSQANLAAVGSLAEIDNNENLNFNEEDDDVDNQDYEEDNQENQNPQNDQDNAEHRYSDQTYFTLKDNIGQKIKAQLPICIQDPDIIASDEQLKFEEEQRKKVDNKERQKAEDLNRKLGRKQFEVNELIFNAGDVVKQKEKTQKLMMDAMENNLKKIQEKAKRFEEEQKEAQEKLDQIEQNTDQMEDIISKLRYQRQAKRILDKIEQAQLNNERYNPDLEIELEKDMTVEEINQKLENMYNQNAKLYDRINNIMEEIQQEEHQQDDNDENYEQTNSQYNRSPDKTPRKNLYRQKAEINFQEKFNNFKTQNPKGQKQAIPAYRKPPSKQQNTIPSSGKNAKYDPSKPQLKKLQTRI